MGSTRCYPSRLPGGMAPTDGQRKRVKAHRVVTQGFLPPVADRDEVDHLDQNVQNNAIENLV
ncbi:HNH endonuclease [Hymenobacter sp. DG01]|uniref:HNH endonuclease n=1 Tax=Hymenobacter sp. DG01 TaxID=2584940 RepID=UPI001124BA4A